MKKFLFYVLFFVVATGFSQNQQWFNQANELYNQGKYSEAITRYEKILESGQHSAELYFNLANAHYKLNHIAPSIYNYEKALQLAPNDKEIKNNMAFAKNMTVDAIDTVPEVGLSRFLKAVTNSFSFDGWAYFTVFAMLAFIVLYLVYYFNSSTARKRLSFVLSFTFLLLSVITLSFAFHKYNLDKNDKPAIVFSQEAQVKSEPNLRSVEAFKLHEGTKVQILDTVNSWKQIKLSDGKTGWISSEDIKAL
ncbi:tetratricopeptide repeat protein [Mangrovimonas cancribranchiae]|uniref:Tetratricopeptide repeat protein n=1 Tax=Mangrovimonas cancribranchiae TaxID=3080055 RepID=A0AAU6NVY7_9FLAO